MYDYRPPRQNVTARVLTLLLFALACAAFVGAALMPKHPVILQSAGLLLLVPLIQIVSRYLAVRHLYRISPYESGEVDLEIFLYRGGTKMQLVCRVGLEEITQIAPLSDSNRKPPHAMRRYNYAPDIRPAQATVLSITNGDGDCEILFCPDERILQILNEYRARRGEPPESNQK